MTTVTKNRFRARQFGGAAAAYGNTTVLRYELQTNSAGGAIDADSGAALKQGDVVVLGTLPAGFRLDDSLVIVSTAFTASVTAKLGFAYEDGVDSAEVPADDDYFGSGLVLSSAARLRNATANPPVVLPKPALLTLTIAGADNDKAGRLDVVIHGELNGNR